jgi:hypothetical protein
VSPAGVYAQLFVRLIFRQTFHLDFFFTIFSLLHLKFHSQKIKVFPKSAIALAAKPDFRVFIVPISLTIPWIYGIFRIPCYQGCFLTGKLKTYPAHF